MLTQNYFYINWKIVKNIGEFEKDIIFSSAVLYYGQSFVTQYIYLFWLHKIFK